MFEDSTFESTGKIHTRSRGWMLATFAFNSAVVFALALFPLLYPETLPRMVNSILMMAAPPQSQPQPLRQPPEAHMTRASEMMGHQLIAPRIIPAVLYSPTAPEALKMTSAATWGMDSSGSGLSVFRGTRGAPEVHSEPQTPARVSRGVMEGLLIRSVLPNYPPLALAMRIEGTVVLQASISISGTIENLRVVSGPELLQKAAIDAVSQWRYRPYLLNGQPVEVETTVNVRFTLH
jgi:periplasmic protein TonB